MNVAVCILAKNEGANIADMLVQLARQTFLVDTPPFEIHVVANGCTDDTVDRARAMAPLFEGLGKGLLVHDLHPGGKSRAWNRAVHELIDPTADVVLFVDADIHFVDDRVLSGVVTVLEADPQRAVCTGHPVKDISAKPRKSVLDRFSLAVSGRSSHVGAINGSLYAARVDVLREIWLPDQTPGEDGFLNAMVTTMGFTRPPDPVRVVTVPRPTHYFRAHSPRDFFGHERRMIIGTTINCWIFEHLWALKLATPAGELIRLWNKTDPHWVDRLIQERAKGRRWLISDETMLGRMRKGKGRRLARLAYFPVALAATLLTLAPAFAANRRLKMLGAAATW